MWVVRGKVKPASAAHFLPHLFDPFTSNVTVTIYMLRWSLNLFRVRGIQVAVHFSFFLLLAVVGYVGSADGGWRGSILEVLILLVLFTCVVLHEFGHSFTAMAFGVNVRRILLLPIGGMAEFDGIPRQPGRELLITIAGPAVNFAIAAGLCAFIDLPAGWQLLELREYPATWLGFAQLVVHWNLLMGLFNLVPVFPMDGGRILRALLATRLPYVRATFVAATIGKVLAVIGVVGALLASNPLSAALFAFIFFAGELEYRAVVRREADEAYQRDALARLYATRRSLEDPPVLTG